jgi:hypothetical protein
LRFETSLGKKLEDPSQSIKSWVCGGLHLSSQQPGTIKRIVIQASPYINVKTYLKPISKITKALTGHW